MRPARLALVTPFAALVAALFAASPAAAASCAAFMDGFAKAAPDLKARFVRPLVVGGAGGETRDLVTDHRIDARLVCAGDDFVRFEAQVQMPADPATRDGFYRIQEAALIAALRWPRARATQTLHAMTSEAAEYLRASQERGDVYVAGKTERHAGAAGDVAMLWSATERTFIVVSGQ